MHSTGQIQDFGRGFVWEPAWGTKVPGVVQGHNSCRMSWGQSLPKPVIFCKLYLVM